MLLKEESLEMVSALNIIYLRGREGAGEGEGERDREEGREGERCPICSYVCSLPKSV